MKVLVFKFVLLFVLAAAPALAEDKAAAPAVPAVTNKPTIDELLATSGTKNDTQKDTRTNQTDIHTDGAGRPYAPGPVVAPELVAKPDVFFRFMPIEKHFNNNSVSLGVDPGKPNTAKLSYSRVLVRPNLFGNKGAIDAGLGLMQNGLSSNLAVRRLFSDDSKSRFFFDIGLALSFDAIKDGAVGAQDTRKHLLLNFGPEARFGYDLNERLAIMLGVNPKHTEDFTSGKSSYGFGAGITLSWTGAKKKKKPANGRDKNEENYEQYDYVPGDPTMQKIMNDPTLWTNTPRDSGEAPVPDNFDDEGTGRSLGSDDVDTSWDGSGQELRGQ